MTPGAPDIRLHRYFKREFMEPIWQRTWLTPTVLRSEAVQELRTARSCSGFGLNEPFAIGVLNSGVASRTATSGGTLLEKLQGKPELQQPEQLGKLVEQLCFGLHRLHQGLGTAHGAVCPFNLAIDREGKASLWSVPTVRFESRHQSLSSIDKDFEQPFFSPRVLEGQFPTPACDLFSLGQILRLAVTPSFPWGDVTGSEFLIPGHFGGIIARCRGGSDRFEDVVELATALNPETPLR